jgi:hypothetical protein
MDEEHRLTCEDLQGMLEYLRTGGKATDRKLRLFAVACCRRIWQLFTDERSLQAIRLGELHADEMIPQEEMKAVREAAREVERTYWPGHSKLHYGSPEWERSQRDQRAIGLAYDVTRRWLGNTALRACEAVGEPVWLAALLKDIFGPLFRPVTIAPAILTWNDGLVIRLAQAAYEERHLPAGTLDNERLAVLADGLEEAGCQDVQILGHLRSGGEHYRGCHILDALLGKE